VNCLFSIFFQKTFPHLLQNPILGLIFASLNHKNRAAESAAHFTKGFFYAYTPTVLYKTAVLFPLILELAL